MEETVQIKLPVFEGPLDLLLHLIRDNKMDIYDIQISLITEQYLEYIEIMKDLNLEVAGDFLVMAATLIHIKSRMLLPIEETADTMEPEDPRLELVMKLLEYQSFKGAALELQEKEVQWAEVLPRVPLPDEEAGEEDSDLSLFDLNLFDLLSAFNRLLEKAPAEVRTITRETLTVKDRMHHIIDLLKANKAIRFEKLFEGDVALAHFLVTFIALLEMVKLGLARAYQRQGFSTIWVINPEAELAPEGLETTPEGAQPESAPKGFKLLLPEKKSTGIIRAIVERSKKDRIRAVAVHADAARPRMPRVLRPIVALPETRLIVLPERLRPEPQRRRPPLPTRKNYYL